MKIMPAKKEPKKETTNQSTPKKRSTRKAPAKKVEKTVKVPESMKKEFPYSMFPVKVIHKDGKDLMDTKICYFQSEVYAKKYIDRCKFKKTDYQMFIKPEE